MKNKNTDGLAFALAAMAALLALSACSQKKQEDGLAEVKTISAKKTERSVRLDAYGSVTYKKKNDVTALVDGTIYELNVQEGSEVNEGDILLRMKNIQHEIQKTECLNQLNSARAKLRAAKNNLTEQERQVQGRMASLENSRASLAQKKVEFALAKKNLEKNRALLEAGGISSSAFEKMTLEAQALETEIGILEKEAAASELGFRSEDLLLAGIEPSEDLEERKKQLADLNLQTAKIEIELAEAALQNAEQSLNSINSIIENLTVRSPAKGLVGVLNFECGERVAQNEKILTVIDMEEPYALVYAQEKDAQKIQVGSPALVEIESLGEKQKGQVSFISPMADLETGNFSVKIPLQNGGKKIRLGMFAQCSIETSLSGLFFALPKSSVLFMNGNNAVFFCVQNGYVLKKECPVEMERDGKIFISSGLEDGEKIVENPSGRLKEGERVKVI